MKKKVKIGRVILGENLPKICIPVMGKTENEITEQIDILVRDYSDTVDIAELRIDYFEGVTDRCRLIALLKKVREHLNDIPFLCTLRSKEEGGELDVSDAEYKTILTNAVDSGEVYAIDVEIFSKSNVYEEIRDYAHDRNIPVVASNHSFYETPETDDLKERLLKMGKQGADVAKIAVMPKDFYDVLRLMEGAKKAYDLMETPIIAISMGKQGAVTRLAGEAFGSVMTFGTADIASAPGQMNAKKLKEAIELLE